MVWLNFLVIAFLIGMAAIWWTYGLFSAVLQLLLVIAAGAIAFAVWEPAAGALLGVVPGAAWGVGLLGPFALGLLVLRFVSDKYVKGNIPIKGLANNLGGAVVGVAAGYVAIGVVILGARFLPLEGGLLGYEPYAGSGNELSENDEGRMFPFLDADVFAAGFFGMLSEGSMAPTFGEASLASSRPDVVRLASLVRAQPDVNSSAAIVPGSVTVTGTATFEATGGQYRTLLGAALVDSLLRDDLRSVLDGPVDDVNLSAASRPLGSEAGYRSEGLRDLVASAAPEPEEEGGPTLSLGQTVAQVLETSLDENMPSGVSGEGEAPGRYYVVKTEWAKAPGTLDSDNRLRINASQARLLVKKDGTVEAVAPVAASLRHPVRDYQVTTPMTTNAAVLFGADAPEQVHVVFRLRPGQEPWQLLLRQSRFELPEAEVVETTMAKARLVGSPRIVPASEAAQFAVAAPDGAVAVPGADGLFLETTTKLPMKSSANQATGLDLSPDGRAVTGGEARAGRPSGNAKIEYIATGPNDGVVRLKTSPRRANSLFGRARDLAGDVSTQIYLREASGGTLRYPFAYAIQEGRDFMFVGMEADVQGYNVLSKIRPLREVRDTADLYLYFKVPVQRRIEAVGFGEEHRLAEPLVVPEPDFVPSNEED